ncbi:MAG: aspartate aminotransferase family protein [Chloroflexota bacterium]
MTHSHPHGSVFYRKLAHDRPLVSHGQGVYLFDESGKRYLDGSGGPLVVNVGHGRAEIVRAMAEQAQAAAYAHAIMFTSDAVESYARELASVLPLDDARVFLLSSGSEVVEAALKLSRQIQMARGEGSRHLIISRSMSYHGTTLGALAVSGRPGLRSAYLPMLRDGPHIQHPYPYRKPMSGEALAQHLDEAILTYGAANVAAFIAEPISGASLGAVAPPDDYWPTIRRICDDHGVLLIADEILCGLGRTGKWWGIQHWDVAPDILVTSKGIAGGYFPLGAVATHRRHVDLIFSTLGDFNHGGTFSHHAVGAAAARETLRILQEERLVERAASMGDILGSDLHAFLGDHPRVGDIRGRGLFWALELVGDRDSKAPFPSSENVAWRVWERAFELGLIVYYSQGCANGKDGDLIMVGPPLIIDKTQIRELVTLLATAVTDVLGN